MDNNFYQDEFEQFLQDEVKQHRMYPSDHIWKNIRTELHGYKAWPALTFISLFIITALTLSTLLISHPEQRLVQASNSNLHSLIKANISSANDKANDSQDYFHQIAPEHITAETFSDQNDIMNVLPGREASVDLASVTYRSEHSSLRMDETVKIEKQLEPFSPNDQIENNVITATPVENEDHLLYASSTNETIAGDQERLEENTVITLNTEKHATADEFLKDFTPVVNVSPSKKSSKFGFQFYITPSTSYRKLTDEKVKEIIQPAVVAMASSQNIPLSSNYAADINDVVRHKPAMGLEIGFAVLYKMTNRLKLTSGIQLNARQYYIETFQSTNDLSSLSLINARGIETFNFYSPYNNNTGYKKTQLDNKIYQVSIPIGIQWDMIQGKHLGINAEASVQPTMTLNNSTYLMSTDYKHYTDGNDFIRKWNINTSLGLNISYKAGAYTWQIGPQVRYQHLPTYSNIYPIKEYLLDYGVRLGFTRQLK